MVINWPKKNTLNHNISTRKVFYLAFQALFTQIAETKILLTCEFFILRSLYCLLTPYGIIYACLSGAAKLTTKRLISIIFMSVCNFPAKMVMSIRYKKNCNTIDGEYLWVSQSTNLRLRVLCILISAFIFVYEWNFQLKYTCTPCFQCVQN